MQVQDNEAVARGENLSISKKHATEVASFIKGDSVETATQKLDAVVAKERAVPYDRHTAEQAHRKGNMAEGRYPVKTAEAIRDLVQSAASNATYEGMDEEKLVVTGVMVNQGNRYYTPKRHRGRQKKATHVTVKVGER